MPEQRVTKKSLQEKVTKARRQLHVAERVEEAPKTINRLTRALQTAQEALDAWQPAAPKTSEPTTVEPDASPNSREAQEERMTSTETAQNTDADFFDADAQASPVETDAPKGLIVGEEPPAPMKRKSGPRKASGPRKGKYDEIVDYLFNHPGVSARLADKNTGEPLTFTNSSVKQTLQKKYEDWNDDEGNVLIVTAVRIAEKTYGAWLRVGQPEIKAPIATVTDEFGSAESVVPADDGSLDLD